MHGKRASLPKGAFNGDPAAMGMGNVLDNGKTKTRSAELPTAGLIDPVESFKKTGQMLFWNPDTAIFNADLQFFFMEGC